MLLWDIYMDMTVCSPAVEIYVMLLLKSYSHIQPMDEDQL